MSRLFGDSWNIIRVGPDDFDVAILGGGVAGLTPALQLPQARPGIQVAVIEHQVHPVRETTHKIGESTIEIAAHYLRDVIGLDQYQSTQHSRWNYPTLNQYVGPRVSRTRYDRGGQS